GAFLTIRTDYVNGVASLQGVDSDNHTTVGPFFPNITGPSPRVIASAVSAGNVARAAPLVIGACAHDAGADHLTIVFDVLRVFTFGHLIDAENESHLWPNV